jgi:hypothetical protein
MASYPTWLEEHATKKQATAEAAGRDCHGRKAR